MKFYQIFLSNKEAVTIDQNDYQKLLVGMNSGSFVQLKNAVVNPSFISHILPISQKTALDTEKPEREVEGYLDEEKGVYVITKDTHPVVQELTDKFKI